MPASRSPSHHQSIASFPSVNGLDPNAKLSHNHKHSAHDLPPVHQQSSSYIPQLPTAPSASSYDKSSVNNYNQQYSTSRPQSSPQSSHHTDLTPYNHSQHALTTHTNNNSDTTIQMNSSELSVLATGLKQLLHQHEQRQTTVNAMNNQLHAFNFMLHYVSLNKTKKLEDDYAVMKHNINVGQHALQSLSTNLAEHAMQLEELENNVSTIESDVAEQQQQYLHLNTDLEHQKQTLEDAMKQYDERIAQHESMIKQQEQSLERLLSVRLRLDFGIDVLIVMIALYLSKLGILPTVIKLVAHLTLSTVDINSIHSKMQRRKRVTTFIQIFRFLLFGFLVRKLRSIAITNGLHHKLGNANQYSTLAKSSIKYAINGVGSMVLPKSAQMHVRSVSGWLIGEQLPSVQPSPRSSQPRLIDEEQDETSRQKRAEVEMSTQYLSQ